MVVDIIKLFKVEFDSRLGVLCRRIFMEGGVVMEDKGLVVSVALVMSYHDAFDAIHPHEAVISWVVHEGVGPVGFGEPDGPRRVTE